MNFSTNKAPAFLQTSTDEKILVIICMLSEVRERLEAAGATAEEGTMTGERLMSFHETDQRFGKSNGYTAKLVKKGLLKTVPTDTRPMIRYTTFLKFLDSIEGCDRLLEKGENDGTV
jgi:hypothetical protein